MNNNIEINKHDSSHWQHITLRQNHSVIHLSFEDARCLVNSIDILLRMQGDQIEEITSTMGQKADNNRDRK